MIFQGVRGVEYPNNKLDFIQIITEQQARFEQQEADVAWLKTFHETTKAYSNKHTTTSAQVYQNIPNPSNGETLINFYIPESVQRAQIAIYDIKGNLYNTN